MKVNPLILLLTNPIPILESGTIKIFQLHSTSTSTEFLVLKDVDEKKLENYNFETNSQLVTITVAEILKHLSSDSKGVDIVKQLLVEKLENFKIEKSNSKSVTSSKEQKQEIEIEQPSRLEKVEPVRVRYKKREKNELLLEEGVKVLVIESSLLNDVHHYQTLFKEGDGLKNKEVCEYIASKSGLVEKDTELSEVVIPEKFQHYIRIWDDLISRHPGMKNTIYEFIAEDQDGNDCKLACRLGTEDIIPG